MDPASRIRKLLAARRAMVDLPYRSLDAGDLKYRALEPTPRIRPVPYDADPLVQYAEDALKADGWEGLFVHSPEIYQDKGTIGAVVYPVGDRNVRRHEVMHGYNRAAMLGVDGMPWQSRAVAALDRVPGLGLVADEMVARMAGGSRPFADVPWDAYQRSYAEQGKDAAARIAGLLHGVQRVADDPRTPMRVGLATGLATSPWWLDALSQDTE
jgi:hypothetical protein